MVKTDHSHESKIGDLRHTRVFDYATMTVIALGVALCCSWPRVTSVAEARQSSRTYISYSAISEDALPLTREPLLFLSYVRPVESNLKETLTELYTDFVASSPHSPVRLPRAFGPSAMFDLNRILQAPEHNLASSYQPDWGKSSALTITNIILAPVSVTISPALDQVGFQLPEWNQSFERFSTSAWRAVFEVSGIDGARPKDVFVIESSGNTELDQWFVRKLYAAHAIRANLPWRGQVSISSRGK